MCAQSTRVLASEAEADSACPAREAIEDAVRALRDPTRAGSARADTVIEVRDLGDRYRVRVKGQSREFSDPGRDCGARARAAAVFVALTLVPSGGGPREEAPEPSSDNRDNRDRGLPEQPPPPPAAPRQTSRSWGAQIEIGVLGAMAPRSPRSQFVTGGELRLVATLEKWGLAFGASVPTQSTFDAGSVRVRESRYPIDVGIRRFWTSGWLLGALDVGAAAALCQLQKVDPPNAARPAHVELAVRVAATLAMDFPRFGLYMRALSEFIPVTHEIAVEPQGIIGRTSALWIGAGVGVVARFH